MKTNYILFSALMSLLAACNYGDEGNAVSSIHIKQPPSQQKKETMICFRHEANGDIAFLELHKQKDSFSGRLVYRLKEKDQNTGVYEGVMQAGLIIGFYTYFSEGQKSVREEIFRWDKDILFPGIGPVIQRNDSVFFQDKKALEWNDKIAFKRVACQ
jgi:hypothetical protein